MKNSVALPLLLMLSLALSCTSENSSNKVAEEQNAQKFHSTAIKTDAEFAVKAASSGYLEIELGRFAAKTASSPKVKEFGQTMASVHNNVNEQLKKIAAQKNITLPSVPDNDKQKRMDELRKKSGAQFDKEYIDLMISYHKEDLEHCRKEVESGNDADLKAWASSMLPALQHHLQMAEGIKQELSK